MLLSIRFSLVCAAIVLAGLFLSLTASAQTAPAWQSAYAIGSGQLIREPVYAVDALGNAYHAGAFLSSVAVGGVTLTSAGSFDCYLAKFAPDGRLLWLRQFGASGTEILYDLAVDAAGNAYLTGSFTTSFSLNTAVGLVGNGLRSPFLLRFSPQGTAEWAQGGAIPNGGCDGSGVRADNAGHVYLTGNYSSSSLSFGSTTLAGTNSTAAYLARFSAATGAPQLLVMAYAYTAGGGQVASPMLRVAPSGGVYLVTDFYQSPSPMFGPGTTLTSRGNSDVLVTRYGAQGTFEWVQQFGGSGADNARSGELDNLDNFYLVGFFSGTATAGSQALVSAGGSDGFLAKYSAQGTPQWMQPLGGTANDGWNGVGLDAAGFPYVTGYFTGAAQVGSVTLTSVGSSDDVAVAAYTPQGQLRWATQAGGTGSDLGIALRIGPTGEPVVFGRVGANSSFGPYTLQPAVGQASFVATLGNSPLAATRAQAAALAAHPNPVYDQLHLPTLPLGTGVQLVDALGRVARETTVSAAAAVSVLGLAPGLYTLRATDRQGRQYVGRVAVE